MIDNKLHAFHQSLLLDKQIQSYKYSKNSFAQYLAYLKNHYNFANPKYYTPAYSRQISLVFNIAIRPILQHAIFNKDIELYAFIDHYLFSSYICPFEDLEWFECAFWDVNTYGYLLAQSIASDKSSSCITNTSPSRRILIVFKGMFKLAHSIVISDFLEGLSGAQAANVDVLLLDSNVSLRTHANVISFASLNSVSKKISSYLSLTSNNKYYNIIWAAAVQNLMLYMGLQMASKQTYWTMKRHSIVHPSITHYASVVSGHRCSTFNGAFWYGGRYRLNASAPKRTKHEILKSLSSLHQKLLTESTVVLGSFARPQKYISIEYWEGIRSILMKHSNSCFIYGTMELPSSIRTFIDNDPFLKQRSINFGWLSGKTSEMCSLIDIYLDNIPFASGLTASQCVFSGGVYLGTDSPINKEASFQNILYDAFEFSRGKKIDMNDEDKLLKLGISKSFPRTLQVADWLINDHDARKTIASNQLLLLRNMHQIGELHFSTDYYSYFMS